VAQTRGRRALGGGALGLRARSMASRRARANAATSRLGARRWVPGAGPAAGARRGPGGWDLGGEAWEGIDVWITRRGLGFVVQRADGRGGRRW